MTATTSGSLCTGYGGLDIAVDALLGTRTVWHAELDPHAALVLAHRFPDVPNLGDITAVDWATVEPVDVLTAGFPCQDLSYAGKGAGITEGTRSGLWFDIADAIGVLRPRLVLLENVAAIVGRRPGLDVVLASLASLGFDAQWTCLRAADIGAPHGRKRWFLAAVAQDADREFGDEGRSATPRQETRGWTRADAGRRGPVPAADADAEHAPQRERVDRGVGGAPRTGAPGDRQRQRVRDAAHEGGATPADAACDRRREGWPESAGQRRRLDAALGRPSPAADTHNRADDGQRARSQPGSGGEAATDADSDGTRLAGVPRRRDGIHVDERGDADRRDSAPAADAIGGGRDGRACHPQRGPVRRAAAAGSGEVDWGDYAPAIRRWEALTSRGAPDPVRLKVVLARRRRREHVPADWVRHFGHGFDRVATRLAPEFVEWMMGLPAGWVTDLLRPNVDPRPDYISRNQALKMLGNGVVPQQAYVAFAHLLDLLLADEVAA